MTASRSREHIMTVGVGLLGFRPDGTVLIGHRIKPGEPETWCLPGGHIEVGETPEQAGLRELAEEAGVLDAYGARAYTVAINTVSGGVTFGVIARMGKDTPRTTEPGVFDRWIWANPAEPPGPLFPASAVLLGAWLHWSPPTDWAVYPFDSPGGSP